MSIILEPPEYRKAARLGMKLLPILAVLTWLPLALAQPPSVIALSADLSQMDIDHLDDHGALTPDFRRQVLTLGRRVYRANCAGCHGADMKGRPARHAPDLSDRAVLYASDNVDADAGQIFPSDMEHTIRYGIRSTHPNTRKLAFMPGFGGRSGLRSGDYPTLSEKEIASVAEFVIQLQGRRVDPVSALRGRDLFANRGGCFDCHGTGGTGDGAIGAPDLTSRHYLYGSDRVSIRASIREGRKGMMPAYESILSAPEIKATAYYLHTVREAAPR